MIDALGANTVAQLLTEVGQPVPQILSNGTVFYQAVDDTLCVTHANGSVKPIDLPHAVVRFHLLKQTLKPLASNRAASLYAIGDDFRLIEFHSKANALTDESMAIVSQGAEDHGRGILVHNDAQHYSAGVDLNAFLAYIDAGDYTGMDAFLHRFQNAVKVEVLLHCDALVVHSNSVMGLVESGVGVLPSGGGVKETYFRWYGKSGNWEEAAWKSWMNLGYGASGSSPELSERLAYFDSSKDSVIINRDRLYCAAIEKLSSLAVDYKAPAEPEFRLAGGDLLSRMTGFMDKGIASGDFFAHDKTVAMHIAKVMCDDSGESRSVSEDDMYARERENFVKLAQTPQTRARIHHVLHIGGALRN